MRKAPKMRQYHPIMIIKPTPWPLISSVSLLGITLGLVLWMHKYDMGIYISSIGGVTLGLMFYKWFFDLRVEATLLGAFSSKTRGSIAIGFYLFLVSEVVIFLSLFWAFANSSISPTIWIGSIWPPLNCFNLPLPVTNTIILLASSITITWSHWAINYSKRISSIALIITIILGILFSIAQGFEYYEAAITISDSIFGSIVYAITGLHAIHVIIGTIYLIFSNIRLALDEQPPIGHLGYDFSIIYWHFVDFIWLIVFSIVYIWGMSI